ncbi:MAG: nucleoside-diphosphate-sugar epimerase [Saprospiraceae bacterium]|jgi:nucleoside-diphosphate-sugar epimerase
MNDNNLSISIMGCGWLGLEVGKFLTMRGFIVNGSTTSEDKLPILKEAGIEPFLLKVNEKIDASESSLQSFFSSSILLLNFPPGRRNPNVFADHPKQIQAVIEMAKKYGTEKVIFISSTGVYGDENKVMYETDALHPLRSSGKALVEVEKYLKEGSSLKINILRLAGLIGGERKAGRFFAGKTDVKGGNARVNMVWRTDCIKVIHEIIRQDIWGEVFNVCADEHPLKKDFYVRKAIEEGFEPPVFSEDAEINFKIVSNEKVKRVLGVKFLGI